MRCGADSLLVFQPMQGGTKSKTLIGILVALIRVQSIRMLPASQVLVYAVRNPSAGTVLAVSFIGTHAEIDEVVEDPAVAGVDATGEEDQT